MQYSIGQTTNATRRAIANLYYRSVRILRTVEAGETLRTTAKVLGLSDGKPRDGQHRGKVWLGIETVGDNGPVVRYERCALVAARHGSPGHSDEIPGPSEPVPLAEVAELAPSAGTSTVLPTHRVGPVGETREPTPCATTSTWPRPWPA